jgi:hypothetical protein
MNRFGLRTNFSKYRLYCNKEPGGSEMMRLRGRPTKKTPVKVEAIIQSLRNAATRSAAARAAGVAPITLRGWMDEDEELEERVLAAEAEAENKAAKVLLDTAVAGDWRPSEALLRRRYRESGWGDQIDVRRIDTAQLLAILQAQADGEQDDAITEDGEPARLTAQDVI